MTFGAPVVSSNASCRPEIYGNSVQYFDPENVEDIAKQISKVISDKKLSQKLSDAGLAQTKKYSWEITAKGIHKAYLQAMN